MRELFFKIFLAGLVLTACTQKKEDDLQLNIHVPQVNLNLDPHKMEDAFSMLIVSQIHRGLLRYSSEGEILPDIAESWKESEDKLRYTFKLKDMSFSDGTPITAQNVVFSFARIFRLQAGIAADVDYIQGANEVPKAKNLTSFGIKAVDNKTVEFNLSYPSALFLKHLAVVDCAVLPLTQLDQKLNFDESGSFSGPYKIQAIKDNKDVQLKKWRIDAHESQTPPDIVRIFTTTQDPVKLATDGLTDTLDRDLVAQEDTEKLKALGWESVPSEITNETFIILNPKKLNLEARKFLYSQVDVAEIVKILSDDILKPAYGLIPNGFSGVLTAQDAQPLKVETKKYGGPAVSFKLDFEEASESEKKIANYLATKWASKNINVQFNPLSKSKKLERMFNKESDAVIGRKGVDYPDGLSVLTYFKGKYEANYFHVNDPKTDSAIAEATKEFNTEKRIQKYKDIQIQILKYYTNIPLFFGSRASGLWSQKVKSVPSHPMGFHTMHLEAVEMRSR